MIDSAISFPLALGAALALAFVLTPVTVILGRRLGLVDLPDARKVHQLPIPRVGGLAIAIAFFLVAIPLYLMEASAVGPYSGERARVGTLFMCGAFLLAVGFIDDLCNIASKYKLLALIAASVALCSSGATINEMSIKGVVFLDFGSASWLVTILWLVAVTVSVNFIDGLDGLAAGVTAIAAGVLAFGASITGNTPVALIALVLMGSLCGFLFHNFNPAKVFMGDCGSMFIGFMLAGSGVLLSAGGGSTRGILLPAVALSIPFFDLLFTIIRRGVLQRRSLFSAERGHIHHRLLDSGLCHRHAVLVIYAGSALAGSVALLSVFPNKWLFAGGAVLLAAALLMLFRAAGSVRGRETLRAIRRNREVWRERARYRRIFEEMQLKFRQGKTFDAWWARVCDAAEQLQFVRITLPLVDRDGSPRVLKWCRSDERFLDCPTIQASLPVRQRRGGDNLTASIEAAADSMLELAGYRIAIFTRLMGEHSLAELNSPEVKGRAKHRTGTRSNQIHASTRTIDKSSHAPDAAPRVAIVHDFLYTYAGAEKVLEQILEVYPEADVFSLFDFVPADKREFLKNKLVHTSFLQGLPFVKSKHRAYLPLMPLAIEQLDVSAYDIVISSSYCVAKGVITRPGQLHVCYCHTPIRFAWDLQHQYLNESGLGFGPRGLLARLILHYVRSWDARSANGVDVFVTNSDFVGHRVEKVYRRDATTIYPPVDTEQFTLGSVKEDFYVTASRMVPYKRMDLIVDAFAQMPDKRLIVIGDGPDFEKLKEKAGPNVRLVGHQPAERLREYLQMAKAFVFAAEEDFGIAPVEAQACGTPVIGFGQGGVAETVIPNKTGILFHEQTVESLVAAVKQFEDIVGWDRAQIRRNAERFSASRFRGEFERFVRREWARFQRSQAPRVIESFPELKNADRTPVDFPSVQLHLLTGDAIPSVPQSSTV
jgi:UDP-N-acetylmuramyl pentapeptide phosphotransferase/UDP-N-acetylglucosamine-1-phosphate transferase/glycosyltransferase involved in cell wall biosynthesis